MYDRNCRYGDVCGGILYLEADVVVMPGEYEPFGMVVLEALNYGIPVVLSDRAVVVEMVQDDTGLRRVDPDDRK